VVLSALGVASISGLTDAANHGGVAAWLGVLLITAPVVCARRQPVVVAAVLAAGAGLNWGLFDHMVRCGVALPAVFWVAFVIGSRCTAWRAAAAGMGLLVVDLLAQAYSDPKLGGPGVLVLMVPITVGFLVAGRLLQGRNAAVAGLRLHTAELRAQREENARLAVVADQARLAEDLDGYLHDQVREIATAAAAGRATLDSEPARAEEAFAAIGDTGRATLSHMRGVVTDLRDQALTQPQPVLAQLDRLLSQAAPARTHLEVTGDPRLLPPGVELSGYRIVEHLLLALEKDPAARIDVVVAFGPDALELRVTGPSGPGKSVRPAVAAASERAALHGGTLHTETQGRRLETVVLLPLVAGRA
jgi:signal transduction histidine kinase